ncbi:MAG: aspartate aminotransferase family protein [Lachnospiraceae bacterium]|nr:aspartate aminotransferase family protein [Lachnospiraceae bacterium]
MSKGTWYPLCRPDDERIKIRRTEGIYLYDTRGKEYIDANSGLWNVPLGYSNQHIMEQLAGQLQKVQYVNACEFGTEEAEELSEMLLSLHHDDIEKIVYTCTGSEAVELSIKLIRKYAALKGNGHKRTIAVLQNSYHGSYYGSMSCSDYDGQEREGYGPLLDGIRELSLPFCTCCRSGQVSDKCEAAMKDKLEQELAAFGDSLAGIIVEPILGSAGVIPLPEWFLRRIMEFAKEYDTITVFDEVATGFGRTGKMFCYQHYDMKPDIITMSKAMNNGILPIGAVAVASKIAEQFRIHDEFIFHLSTQNGNALCCAATKATIEELQKNNGELLVHAQEMSDYFAGRIRNEFMEQFPRIFDLRGRGMMFAIDLLDKDMSRKMRFNELLKVVNLLKKYGVIAEWSYLENLTSCMVIFLPYIIQKEQIDTILEKLLLTFNRMLV